MRNRTLILSFFVCGLLAACGSAPYTMTAPQQFKRFEDDREFKLITADGVMLKAREMDNYPQASLEFWTDAAKQHLEKSGYIHETTICFKTTEKKDACTLRFALPHGAEDWIFQETIFVEGDTLVLVEATGEFQRFKAIEKDLDAALTTFRPNL